MSTKPFQIDEQALQEARARAQSGHAQILILKDGSAHFFVTDEVIGYLSWTAILDGYPERIDIRYGHDLPNGFYTFPVTPDPGGWVNVGYREPDGTEHYNPVSGTLFLRVERPDSGPVYKHTGVLLNIKFESGDKVITLNGTYVNSSD